MKKAELYTRANPMQMKDARFALDKHREELCAGEKECVLDVGCGPGNVTASVLKSVLHKDTKIVGCDISGVMIAFANAKHGNENLCFRQLDIQSTRIGDDWKNKTFHKVFSFYCLHWIYDQRKAAENIYSLLKPGGKILLSLLATNPIFTLYEELSMSPKWKDYMKDVKRFISPYHKSSSPGVDFAEVLQRAKFKNIKSSIEERRFVFPSLESLIKSIEAVSPFFDIIPPDLHDDYTLDIIRVIKETELAQINPNGSAEIQYQLIVAVATKSYCSV